MRMTTTAILAAALLLIPVAAGARDSDARRAEAAAKAEVKLAKMLDGRVAGEPTDCIFLPSIRGTRVIDNTAIVYDAGRTLWVNRPRSGAESLDDDNILVTRLHSSSLCSIDIVELRDRYSHFYSGFIGLGEFVPYKRVALRP